MRQVGGYMLFFGVGSSILYFMGMQFKLLMWMDMMGEVPAWSIRLGLIFVGALLLVLGSRQPAEAAPEQ